jgi:hypothetical protein
VNLLLKTLQHYVFGKRIEKVNTGEIMDKSKLLAPLPFSPALGAA